MHMAAVVGGVADWEEFRPADGFRAGVEAT